MYAVLKPKYTHTGEPVNKFSTEWFRVSWIKVGNAASLDEAKAMCKAPVLSGSDLHVKGAMGVEYSF